MGISVCVQNPVPTLILNVPGTPDLACQRIAAMGAKQAWVLDDSSPAIGGTVGLTLHRGQDRLNVGCTDVAGSTTATLSLTPAIDAALP